MMEMMEMMKMKTTVRSAPDGSDKKLLTKLLKYIITYSDNYKSDYLDLEPEVKIQHI